MSLREEQCNKICRILDDVLANRPTERDALIVATRKAFDALSELHWIPVTEPPKSDFVTYYATCRSKVDDRENWVIEGMYTKYSGWEYPPMVRDDRAEIIAWMPKELPEPYKGVMDGDD